MFILVWDRDREQDPLFPIVSVLFPVPPLGPSPVQDEYAIRLAVTSDLNNVNKKHEWL